MGVHEEVRAAVVAVFVAAVALNLAVQRARGIRAFVLAADPARRVLEVVAIAALATWLAAVALEGVPGIAERLGEVRFDAPLADALGSALAAGGLAFALVAYVHMGRAWRIGIDPESREELVTRGAFAWSRNPIYLFLDLLALGAALGSGRDAFLVACPLIWVGVHLRILAEERFLAARHGAEFARYRARTWRYLGRRSAPADAARPTSS